MTPKPAPLKNTIARPLLHRGISCARGREVRLWRRSELEKKVRSREAQLAVAIICGTLYAGFWLQFVVGMLYNHPAIHALSGGNWYPPPIEFYQKEHGTFPFSMAGNFLFYSGFGSALALFFGFLCSRGVERKKRLRFAVCLFVVLIMGWSIAAYQGEEAAWTDGLEVRISRAREFWRQEGEWERSESELRRYRLEVERLETLREQFRRGRD